MIQLLNLSKLDKKNNYDIMVKTQWNQGRVKPLLYTALTAHDFDRLRIAA